MLLYAVIGVGCRRPSAARRANRFVDGCGHRGGFTESFGARAGKIRCSSLTPDCKPCSGVSASAVSAPAMTATGSAEISPGPFTRYRPEKQAPAPVAGDGQRPDVGGLSKNAKRPSPGVQRRIATAPRHRRCGDSGDEAADALTSCGASLIAACVRRTAQSTSLQTQQIGCRSVTAACCD